MNLDINLPVTSMINCTCAGSLGRRLQTRSQSFTLSWQNNLLCPYPLRQNKPSPHRPASFLPWQSSKILWINVTLIMAYTQRMESIKLVIGQVSYKVFWTKKSCLSRTFFSCTKGDTSLDKSVRYLQTYILVFMSNFANLFDYYL